MIEQFAAQKKLYRTTCRQIRDGLDIHARRKASEIICAKIENWSIFQHSMVILAYMPIKTEVDLRPLLGLYPEKKWLLPRILPGSDHLMCFHPYIPDRLVYHPFGMAEPDADLPAIESNEIELTLIPGLAYDTQGWRLGYGGGYYDRFLINYRGISLGISFDALLFDYLPHDENDISMDWIMTENKLFQVIR